MSQLFGRTSGQADLDLAMLSVLGEQIDGHGLAGQSHIGRQVERNGAIAFVILPVKASVDLDGVNGVFLGDGTVNREEAELLVNRVGRTIIVNFGAGALGGPSGAFPAVVFHLELKLEGAFTDAFPLRNLNAR
jgi:hypothetical protein